MEQPDLREEISSNIVDLISSLLSSVNKVLTGLRYLSTSDCCSPPVGREVRLPLRAEAWRWAGSISGKLERMREGFRNRSKPRDSEEEIPFDASTKNILLMIIQYAQELRTSAQWKYEKREIKLFRIFEKSAYSS